MAPGFVTAIADGGTLSSPQLIAGDNKKMRVRQIFNTTYHIPTYDMVSKATLTLSLGYRTPLRLPFLSQRSSVQFVPAQVNLIDPPCIADVLQRIGV